MSPLRRECQCVRQKVREYPDQPVTVAIRPRPVASHDFRLAHKTTDRRVYPRASYITVNISSPNTQGLRDLQEEATLARFIGTLRDEQEKLGARHGQRKPMLLKIAPDLTENEMDAIAEVLSKSGIDGVICTNTTVDRKGVESHRLSNEAGGLSGKPVFAKSTAVLKGMRERLPAKIDLVGVGGITHGANAAAKREAGARLVQFYTGMIYRGPALVGECVEAMRACP